MAGVVTEASDPKEVHNSNPEYKKWGFDRFKPNLKNLIKSVRNGTTTIPKWTTSKAREILREDIISGNVTDDMAAEDVYGSNNEFKVFPFESFKTNLETLKSAIYSNIERMESDCMIYGHDIALLEVIREQEPYPVFVPWHRSPAKNLLEQDIKDGKHLALKEDGSATMPKDIYDSRPEYQAFPLRVLRDHIYQEIKKIEKREHRFAKKKMRMEWICGAAVVDVPMRSTKKSS